MRILGLDFGSKTVGVAVSDPLLLTAQGVEIVRRQSPNKLRQTLARIEAIIKEYEVDRIVLGYPKNMNNTEGERCEKTKEFKEMLERRTGLSVILWDERLTTVSADNYMMESGIRREDRKKYVDEIAAIFILQSKRKIRKKKKKKKVVFVDPETKEEIEFFVVEETQINGKKYLLVTEEEDGDSDAYILEELEKDKDDIVYGMVEDDATLTALGKVFAELIDDADIKY